MKRQTHDSLLVKSTRYGEADLVVKMITRESGLISALARSARKSRKRFGGSLDFFVLMEATLKPSPKGLWRLESVEPKRRFAKISADIDAYLAGTHFLEVAHMGSREESPDEPLFTLVERFLELLDSGGDPKSLILLFRTRVLGTLGYGLTLDGCAHCTGSLDPAGVFYSHGGLVCADCSTPGLARLSTGSAKTLQAALRMPVEKLGTLKLTDITTAELGALVESALIDGLGARPRSIDGLSSAFCD